jgi:hypothetical protein
MIRDPIGEAMPPGRLPTHRPEHDERLCPTCGAPLEFLHHDHAEVPMHGGLYSSTELAILLALAGGGIAAMMLLGTIPGIVLLLLAVPLAWRWQRDREVALAVWRCGLCDRYWQGDPLRPWQPPKVSPLW